MPVKLVPKGVGRPDFSIEASRVSMPLSPIASGKSFPIYHNSQYELEPGETTVVVPANPDGILFPGQGEKIRLIKMEISTELNSLIGVDLLQIIFDPTRTAVVEVYNYYSKRSYQSISIEQVPYEISYPSAFGYVITNYNPTETITVYVSTIAEIEKI